jgi:hypothetical protein
MRYVGFMGILSWRIFSVEYDYNYRNGVYGERISNIVRYIGRRAQNSLGVCRSCQE